MVTDDTKSAAPTARPEEARGEAPGFTGGQEASPERAVSAIVNCRLRNATPLGLCVSTLTLSQGFALGFFRSRRWRDSASAMVGYVSSDMVMVMILPRQPRITSVVP
jgi:hypothetical protein